jgi:hypothetical protein
MPTISATEMSLRYFHLLFIFLSAAFSAGFGVWIATDADPFGPGWTIPAAAVAGLVAIGLGIYGIRFYRKTAGMTGPGGHGGTGRA